MSGFDFLDTVITVLGVAKKGAEVYNSLSEKQESAGFATPNKMSTRTSGGGAKASLQSMDQPIGMGIPNMETAYRYFSNNLSRDNKILLHNLFREPHLLVKIKNGRGATLLKTLIQMLFYKKLQTD